MTSKYNRYSAAVSRQSESSEREDHWLNQFEKTLLKGAVQPKSDNFSEQINSIMNGKSKYPSVAAAVQDMQERSGLTAYLAKQSHEETVSKNTGNNHSSVKKSMAEDQNNTLEKKVKLEPIVIQKHPAIMKTLDNHIKSSKGNLSVPAIIDKLRSIHQNDVSEPSDWEDDNLIRLVSKMNLMAKRDNPDSFQDFSHLGERDVGSNTEIDATNTDAFHALMPQKM